jgi:transposase InsO family protein
MDYHQNARLTIHSREQLARKVLEQRCTPKLAAASFGVSAKTAAKWVHRYHELGPVGLRDRSSRPERSPRQTCSSFSGKGFGSSARAVDRVADRTADRSEPATVSRILRRLKLSRMRDLDPKPSIQRYEHAEAGDLLHLDIKKLGRIVRPSHRVTGKRRDSVDGAGWEYVHVAIDDHPRIAFSAVYPDEKADSTVAFLHAALAYYARLGIRFKAVLTDNGPAYRSQSFAAACRALDIRHRFTRPYTPRTNGKAERCIQTALRE